MPTIVLRLANPDIKEAVGQTSQISIVLKSSARATESHRSKPKIGTVVFQFLELGNQTNRKNFFSVQNTKKTK